MEKEIVSDSAEISGQFSQREAENLASVLNNPLDTPLEVKEQYEVGPSLAADAVSSGVKAAIIGTAAVCAFMITFYATGGLVAVITLAINIVIILGVMASIHATMTMPGLAGIVLTIGMAVDANILIFERMREELAEGKNLVSANRGGFFKALTTILDAHFVQLIICVIMILLGQGPIKGFGVTLLIGVVSTLFSVLITGHLLMELLIDSGALKKMTMRRMLKELNVDFVKLGKPAAIGSVALVVVSIGYVFYQGDRIYGIDFAGGDQITANYTQKIDVAQIRELGRVNNIGEINPTYVNDLSTGRAQLKIETAFGKSEALFGALQKANPNAGLVKVGTTQIGATIGKEIKWNALKAIAASMVVILIYIAFRFEFGFGIGAMASTLHDVLMNIGIFVLCGHQFLGAHGGGDPLRRRLLHQRNRRRVRPHPRGAETQSHRGAEGHHQQRDPEGFRPHDHDGDDDLPRGSGALHLRRRPAARHRLHLPRRHRHVDVLRHLHRRPGVLLVAQG